MKLFRPMIDRQAAYRLGVGLAVMGVLLVLMAVLSAWIAPARAAGRGRLFPVVVGVTLVGLGVFAMVTCTREASAAQSPAPRGPVSRGHRDAVRAGESVSPQTPTDPASGPEIVSSFENDPADACDAQRTRAARAANAGEQVCSWCHATNDSVAKHCNQCGTRI